MQINKHYEPENNLKDALVFILYRWRSILAGALIGALLLTGYQYATERLARRAGKQTKAEIKYEEELKEYEDELGRYEDVVAEYEGQLATQDSYQKESVYYRLDANALWTARITYLVTVDPSVLDALPPGSAMDPADSVLPLYLAPQASVTDKEVLKDVFGTDTYFNELINVSTDPTANTFSVTVKGGSRERVEKGAEFFIGLIEDMAAKQPDAAYPHTVTLVSRNTYFGPDASLKNKKADSVKERNDIVKNITTAAKKVTDLEKSGEPSKPGLNLVRDGLVGALLGAFVMIAVYLSVFMLNGRLKNGRELAGRFGLPVFGEAVRSGSLHKGRGLDKLIGKWEHALSPAEEEAVFDGVAALIRERKAERVVLAGTVSQADLEPVLEALRTRLEGAEIAGAAGLPENAEGLAEALRAPAVILVEKRNGSKVADIRREAEMLAIGKAAVAGAVVI